MIRSARSVADLVVEALQVGLVDKLNAEDHALLRTMMANTTPVPELLAAGRVHVRSRALREQLHDQEDQRRRNADATRREVEGARNRRTHRAAEIERLSARFDVPVPRHLQDLLRQAQLDLATKEDWITRNGRTADQLAVMAHTRAIEESQRKLKAVRAKIRHEQKMLRSRQIRSNRALIDQLRGEQDRDPEPAAITNPSGSVPAAVERDLLRRLDTEVSRFPLPGRVAPFARA